MRPSTHRRQKLCVLLVLFLGYVGFSLVFPILPPLFLNPEETLLPTSTSYTTRNVLLGLAFAMYPLGQFIGCPIIGKLSDKYGRRPVLNITLLLTSLMYIVTGFAVSFFNVTLLFLARFITGIFEGNITTANAVMADISKNPKEKARNFGWIMTFSSSGWVIGPLIGGKLADPSIFHWFNFSTPFWAAALILFFCMMLVYFTFEETNNHRHNTKLSLPIIFSSLIRSLKQPHLRKIYCINGFFYLGTFLFFTYLPVWLIKFYSYNASKIGDLESYVSIIICLAPFSYTAFSKRLPHKWTLYIAALGLAISFIPFIVIRSEISLWFTVIPISYFIALGFSFGSIAISDLTKPSMQGEALGVNQSIMVLSETLVGVIGGFLVAIWVALPFVMGSIFAFIATLFILSLKQSSQAPIEN